MAKKANDTNKPAFSDTEYKLRVRPGTKAGWWEMIVTKPDGTEQKMIGRKVNRFWSEQDKGDQL